MLMFSGTAAVTQVSKKAGPPVQLSSPRAASPQAPTPALTAGQQQALQSLILQHQRIRGRLQAPEAADLDQITAHVRQTLFGAPLPGNLLTAATQILSHKVPGLSNDEATGLAEYVLGGIAALPPAGAAGSAGGGSQSALLTATKQMQEAQMSFNLQYLQLQSQMQDENRSYTMVSNIMKTKHDTAKNSISNIR
jgi:hypothetical protein